MSQFSEVLQQNGVIVNGTHTFKEVPEYCVLSTSFGLTGYIDQNDEQIFAESFAESIFHDGVQQQSAPQDVVRDYLVDLGSNPDDIKIINGSDSVVRFHPTERRQLVLSDMYGSKVQAEYGSLSIAGIDGTLRKRFSEEDAAGKIRGKTGSLNWVFCVGGLVFGQDGDTYSVVIFMNDLKTSSVHARTLQDSFLEKLIRTSTIDK